MLEYWHTFPSGRFVLAWSVHGRHVSFVVTVLQLTPALTGFEFLQWFL